MAGDLVNQAKPNMIPNIKERSNRGYFEINKVNNKEVKPKNDNKVSAKASRSKKKVKGSKQYINEVKMLG